MDIRKIIKNVLRSSPEVSISEQNSLNKFMDYMIMGYNIWKGIGFDGNTLYFAKKGIDFPTHYSNYDFYINTDVGYLQLKNNIKDFIDRYIPFDDDDVLYDALRVWFKSSLGITFNDVEVGWGEKPWYFNEHLVDVTSDYV